MKFSEIVTDIEACLLGGYELLGVALHTDGRTFVAVQTADHAAVCWRWTGRSFEDGIYLSGNHASAMALHNMSKRASGEV